MLLIITIVYSCIIQENYRKSVIAIILRKRASSFLKVKRDDNLSCQNVIPLTNRNIKRSMHTADMESN